MSTTFTQLGIPDDLNQGIEALGILEPTPIQEQTIKLVMKGHDVMGAAQTGTGKTAAFGLPILHRLLEGNGNEGAKRPISVRAGVHHPSS